MAPRISGAVTTRGMASRSFGCVSAEGPFDVFLRQVDSEPDLYSVAVMIRVRQNGFLFALPAGAIPQEVLEAAGRADFSGVLGPYQFFDLTLTSGESAEVLLVDIARSGLQTIFKVNRPEALTVDLLRFDESSPEAGVLGYCGDMPEVDSLLAAAEDYFEAADFTSVRVQDYQTAEEGDAPEEVAAGGDEERDQFQTGDEGSAKGRGRGRARNGRGGLVAVPKREPAPSTPPQGPSMEDFRLMLREEMDSRLGKFEQRVSQLERSSSRGKGSGVPPVAKVAAKSASSYGEGLTGVGPQLFKEARKNGLTAEQSHRLAVLAGPPPKLKDPGPGLLGGAPVAPGPHDGEALSEGDDGEGVVDIPNFGGQEEASALVAAAAGAPGVFTQDMMKQFLNIMEASSAGKSASSKGHAPSDDVLGFLTVGSASVDEGGKPIPGVRGIAAREIVVENFDKNPGASLKSTRRLLAKSRRKTLASLEPGDMEALMEHQVPFGDKKCLTYWGFSMARLWAMMEEGQHLEAHALIGRLCGTVEQVALQGGTSYELGWMLSALPEPPFQTTAKHQPPAAASLQSLGTHATLADPRVVTVCLGALQDYDQIAERASRLGAGGFRKQKKTAEEYQKEREANAAAKAAGKGSK